MKVAEPQRFQAVRGEMRKFQKVFEGKQSEGYDLIDITNLHQKTGETFRNREAEKANKSFRRCN